MYARRLAKGYRPVKTQQASRFTKFDAPTAGWISNRSLSDPRSIEGVGAAILDNFFPTPSKVVMRRGKQLYATLGDGTQNPTAMFAYRNGTNRHLFASTDTTIYDVTNVQFPSNGTITTEDADVIVTEDGDYFGWVSTIGLEVGTGYTGGNWVTAQFAATGGFYLIGVNGEDLGFIYDGTTWGALAFTFTGGLTSADMSYVFVYKNRIWFVEKNSMNIHYAQVDSISGTTDVFPLVGVFKLGGALLFGAAWSMEGSLEGGLSQQVVFISTEGEVAVFQGTDPAEATTWSEVGVYRIGNPLGNLAHLQGGGDIAVATTVGLVPLSKAISLDVTSLNVATISYKIADAWSDAVAYRGTSGWHCKIWPEQKLAAVAPPDLTGSTFPVIFVSNTETGAWARYTGWNALCMEVFEGRLFIGSPEGKIFVANVGGLDDGQSYTAAVAPLFDDLGSPASLKVGKIGRAVFRANTKINSELCFMADYDMTMCAPPSASGMSSPNLWGTGVWGQSSWGAITPSVISQDWESIGGAGYALTTGAQVTSGSIAPLDAELIRIEMTYSESGIVS